MTCHVPDMFTCQQEDKPIHRFTEMHWFRHETQKRLHDDALTWRERESNTSFAERYIVSLQSQPSQPWQVTLTTVTTNTVQHCPVCPHNHQCALRKIAIPHFEHRTGSFNPPSQHCNIAAKTQLTLPRKKQGRRLRVVEDMMELKFELGQKERSSSSSSSSSRSEWC